MKRQGVFELAVVISSSFIMFLLIIGILTRYYIYKTEQNSSTTFSDTARSVSYMVAICLCISFTSSLAFLCNKKQDLREAVMVNNLEMPPRTSIGAEFHSTETELEALPYQTLLDNANVHYGEKPNLERILLGCKGSSVVVLVSGPRRLRQEVATLCSPKIADNIHFKSISLSW